MSRSQLRVAAVQMDCAGSQQEVEKRALKMIRRAAGARSSIACLPEHWVPGGVEDEAAFLRPFEREAREWGIFVIPGAEFVRKAGSTTVESFLVGPAGVVGSQQKVHLFGRERRNSRPGSNYSVLKADGARIGIAICHDLVYPEVARILALKGAEVIFSPARISKVGLYPWHLYVNARALENRIPVVSPNILNKPSYPGGSTIVGIQDAGTGVVYPKTAAEAGSKQSLLIADLDLEVARRLRWKRLRARRVDTFAALLQEEGAT